MPTHVRCGLAGLGIIIVVTTIVFFHEYNGKRMTDLDWQLLNAAGTGVVILIIAVLYYREAPEKTNMGQPEEWDEE